MQFSITVKWFTRKLIEECNHFWLPIFVVRRMMGSIVTVFITDWPVLLAGDVLLRDILHPLPRYSSLRKILFQASLQRQSGTVGLPDTFLGHPDHPSVDSLLRQPNRFETEMIWGNVFRKLILSWTSPFREKELDAKWTESGLLPRKIFFAFYVYF